MLYAQKALQYYGREGGLNDGTQDGLIPTPAPGQRALSGVPAVWPRYDFGFYKENMNGNDLYELWENAYNQFDPLNTYLHYVQSADLSKDELQSILSKINGSSIATQYQLTEVKKAVEAKLENME